MHHNHLESIEGALKRLIYANLYQKIVASYPLFSKLDESHLAEFLKLAFEKKLNISDVIFHQGDPIDAVYFIIEGQVEVAKRIEASDENETPQLILKTGDPIGINETGFFSKTGVRTATLTCISDVTLIGWPVKTFVEFLQESPCIGSLIKQSSELIMRVNFIKKMSFFTNLSAEQITEIARNLEKQRFSSGTVIFNQGDLNDECYLIQSGKVEISIRDKNDSIFKVITLEPSMIFGEIALLTKSPRNATATMIETGDLLILTRETFQKLVQPHLSVTESMLSLAMERSYPAYSQDVSEYHLLNHDDQTVTILKNNKLKRYYQLSPFGYFVWQQLDGTKPIQEIITNVMLQYGSSSSDMAYNIIADLVDSEFVSFPTVTDTFFAESAKLIPLTDLSSLNNIKRILKKIFFIKVFFSNTDHFITKNFNNYFKFFFTAVGKSLVFSIILLGLFIFPLNLSHIDGSLITSYSAILILLAIFVSNYLFVIFHELGHAFAVKSYERDVNRVGIVFYWLGLFAFVDTSDMWLSNREARIRVDLAGPIVDLFLASIASLCTFMIPNPELKWYFMGLSLFLYYDVVSNMNPIDENDGYHILNGILKTKSLRESSIDLLKNIKIGHIFTQEFANSHRNQLIYWAACFTALLFNIILIYIAQYLIRQILPATILGISTMHLAWIFPLILVIVFAIKIFFLSKKKM